MGQTKPKPDPAKIVSKKDIRNLGRFKPKLGPTLNYKRLPKNGRAAITLLLSRRGLRAREELREEFRPSPLLLAIAEIFVHPMCHKIVGIP